MTSGDENQGPTSRLIMRTAGSLRVILNSKIFPEMTVEKPTEKNVRLTAMDDQVCICNNFLAPRFFALNTFSVVVYFDEIFFLPTYFLLYFQQMLLPKSFTIKRILFLGGALCFWRPKIIFDQAQHF